MTTAILILSILTFINSILIFLALIGAYGDLIQKQDHHAKDIKALLKIIFNQNTNVFKKIKYVEEQALRDEAEKIFTDEEDEK